MTVLYAFIGGFLPALLWLFFWLYEDHKRPEPRGALLLTFIAGMLAIPLVLPFQRLVLDAFGFTLIAIILWSLLEETFKFFGAYIAGLSKRAYDEPIDALIYMITAALGFAALENMLFVLGPVSEGAVVQATIVSNFRFVGATLLHILASATVGIGLAYAFYARTRIKKVFLFGIGLILATALHALFNFFIMKGNSETMFFVFASVWIGIIALILIFERVKRLRKKPHPLIR